ncbi:MAG TPA: DUF4388 domain-containing protein [Vicinamibacteria bacterium]|jgi:hypothetical protein
MTEASPLSGHIDPLSFPFLLMDLRHQGATGSLRVDGPTYQKALYFRGGRVLFGSSNDPRDQLGAILIENGALSPEQFEEANGKVGPGNPLAKVLSDTGFVSQRELSEAAAAKVERILSEVLAYTSGSFEFEDGVLPKGAVDLKLSTERLVIAAIRRLSDRAFVLRHLGSLEVVLSPVPGRQQDLPQAEAFAWELLAQIDGRRTLKDAASDTHLDEFEAAKIACALLFLGIVSRGTDETGAGTGFAIVDDQAEIDLGDTVRSVFTVPAAAAPVAAAPDLEPVAPAPVPPAPAQVTPAPARVPAAPPVPVAAPAPALVRAEPPVSTPAMPSPVDGVRETFTAPPSDPAPAIGRSVTPSRLPLVPPPPARSAAPPAIVGYDLRLPAGGQSSPPSAPVRPAPKATTKEDLAALDILLNPRTAEGPLAPLDKPAAPGPSFGSGRRKGRSGSSGRALVIGAAVTLVLGAVAGAYYVAGRSGPPPASVPPKAATPPQTLAEAPPPTTVAAVAPPVTGAAAPGAPVASLPPATTPAAAPLPSEDALTTARRLMGSGDLAASARSFASHVRRTPAGTRTVQLMVACSGETVQKAMAGTGSPELLILPVEYQGRSCFRMCWGLYPTDARAQAAARALPPYFRQGGVTPRVVPAASLLP